MILGNHWKDRLAGFCVLGWGLWESVYREGRHETEEKSEMANRPEQSSQVGCHPQGEATLVDKAMNVSMSLEKVPAGPLFISDCY